jgi:hypothetical protein
MKIMLLSLLSLPLMGMSDSRPVTMPNTPELRPFVNITGNDDNVSIHIHDCIPDLEAARAHAQNPVAAQLNVQPSSVQQAAQTLANNKTLILSNLATATLGAAVTLIVHFTAPK